MTFPPNTETNLKMAYNSFETIIYIGVYVQHLEGSLCGVSKSY